MKAKPKDSNFVQINNFGLLRKPSDRFIVRSNTCDFLLMADYSL